MKANDSSSLSKVFEVVASSRRAPCSKREKKRNQKWEREVFVCVLQKLDILFGLNTPPHPIVHTIPPLASSTLITNLFFQKNGSIFINKSKKKRIILKGKKEKKYFGLYIYI